MNVHQSKFDRLAGLRRFALAITLLNILGHTCLGFEQSKAQIIVTLATAYGTELLLETIDARVNQRLPKFVGGISKTIDFLLPAHITGLAIGMLLYANDRLLPIAFATAVAIGSKTIFRINFNNKSKHFFNPSNFGITVTLLVFPWVGFAPPYQFTENLSGVGNWILPLIIVVSGTLLNSRFTARLPLIMSWILAFVVQAFLRSLIFDISLATALIPMTSVGFVLFTFYMISDPGTTPRQPQAQVWFGIAVAVVYGLLMSFHIVFGLFFALTIVCTFRGLSFLKAVVITNFAFRRTAKTLPAGEF